MNVGSIRFSKCSFWFYLLGEKSCSTTCDSCLAPPLRSERPCWRSSGVILRGLAWERCCSQVPADPASLCGGLAAGPFLLLFQVSPPQLLSLFLHFFLVPLDLLHQNFKVFDFFLDQGPLLGGRNPEQLQKNIFNLR